MRTSKMETSGKTAANLMQRSGWQAGKGLGKDEQGAVEHVKTVKKDDVLGIGYDAKVQQTWSAQGVAFADILKRIQSGTDASKKSSPPGETEGEAQVSMSSPHAGKHVNAYQKRRRLKTEGLSATDGKEEILGSSSKRTRGEEKEEADIVEEPSSLKSPLLLRIMHRVSAHEARVDHNETVVARISKPCPPPPKATATPFHAPAA